MSGRTSRIALPLVFLLPVALLGSAARSDATPEELIRLGNDAFIAGNSGDADRYYLAAEELTGDPGLVAFNRAAVLFQLTRYADAELHYARVLDETACPPDRAAKAWYNRGTCLLRRPDANTALYRSAIACLERCLDSYAADEPLKADARHNLELAKLLWNKARKLEKKPDNPNVNPPPEDPRSEPPPRSIGNDTQFGNPDEGNGTTSTTVPKSIPQPVGGTTTKPNPVPGSTQSPGSQGHLQPLAEDPNAQPLSPEEAREYLRRTAGRLKHEQQILRQTLYGPERPGLHDW